MVGTTKRSNSHRSVETSPVSYSSDNTKTRMIKHKEPGQTLALIFTDSRDSRLWPTRGDIITQDSGLQNCKQLFKQSSLSARRTCFPIKRIVILCIRMINSCRFMNSVFVASDREMNKTQTVPQNGNEYILYTFQRCTRLVYIPQTSCSHKPSCCLSWVAFLNTRLITWDASGAYIYSFIHTYWRWVNVTGNLWNLIKAICKERCLFRWPAHMTTPQSEYVREVTQYLR